MSYVLSSFKVRIEKKTDAFLKFFSYISQMKKEHMHPNISIFVYVGMFLPILCLYIETTPDFIYIFLFTIVLFCIMSSLLSALGGEEEEDL